MPELKLNGFHSHSKNSDKAVNWREDVVNQALFVQARDGNGIDVMAMRVRQQMPGSVTIIQWLNSDHLHDFLQQKVASYSSLMAGKNLVCDTDEELIFHHQTSWYAFEWSGCSLELAVCPSRYCNAHILLIGSDEAALKSLSAALEEFTTRPKRRCMKYDGYWDDAPEIEDAAAGVGWDDVILAPDVSQGMRESVEGFVKGKAAYKALGFSWRRGILLIGPPGTGKTMLCKAVASSLPEWPLLYVRTLRDTDNRDAIVEIFSHARKLAPCLLVFEDIDGMISGDNRTTLLNEMDGFRDNDGLLIVASSNHPGKIDEALLKRPSRFDRVFHVGLPKLPEREAYCRHLLSRGEVASYITPDLDIEVLARQVAEKSDGFTPAYIKEAITAAALSRAQEGAMKLDAEFGSAVMREVEALKDQLKKTKDPDQMAFLTGGSNSMGLRFRD